MTQTEALRLALASLESWSKNLQDYEEDLDRQAITAIKTALEAKDEPVFNKPHLDIEGPLHVVCRCPACKVQPQRKPLTDEEIWEALRGIDCTRPMLITRAIEAAHGIKGGA